MTLFDDYPAPHLHPELANLLRDLCDGLDALEPGTWMHDDVLAEVVTGLGGLARDALLGSHSDGRPLKGTKRYDQRRAMPPVWDDVRCCWRSALSHELTKSRTKGSLRGTSPKRLIA